MTLRPSDNSGRTPGAVGPAGEGAVCQAGRNVSGEPVIPPARPAAPRTVTGA
ncbi:hypothetical protein SCATT_p16260 (plasmid) [Streptantibioticus cattleyicolor NRRL 8057 = DSM 46488]|uniref:Uncharacterized protein n=1 Tax=Streptantibioticus cattleyicolor (strain ATCC 35852 / DSM 46488 / JCM 4925 / NBRC 14057 / NRRL 8057) TaxID=1003195 RepID=G8XHI2_STREN|nr:hypothetical protein SCATT_p16260 [Streptantibioticus cattleyicolor NRRL 8057 = DSM 46488]